MTRLLFSSFLKQFFIKTFKLLALFSLFVTTLAAQNPKLLPKIEVTPNNKGYTFTAIDPEINCGGAKEESFRYFWEFGDGNYAETTEKTIKYTYREAKQYAVRLFVTPRYCATGLGYPSAPYPLSVKRNNTGKKTKTSFESLGPKNQSFESFYLKVNHNARNNESLVAILSFKNLSNQTEGGKVFLFYNKQKIDLAGTAATAIRYQHLAGGQQLLPSTLSTFAATNPAISELALSNNGQFMWEYNALGSKAHQNIFVTLIPKVPYNRRKQFIDLTGVFIANSGQTEVFKLPIEVIDAHDPNKIESDERALSYRKVEEKEFGYTLHFQNEGNAPAINIMAEASIPNGISNAKEDIKVTDYHPKCGDCFSWEVVDNKIQFTFTAINLPGEKQKGIKEDKTEGYIKYKLKPKNKQIKKKTVKSFAGVYFDQAYKEIKRPAKTWFKPGVSIVTKVGINGIPKSGEYEYYLGMTLSPFKSQAPYYQPEISLNYQVTATDIPSVFFRTTSDNITIRGDSLEVIRKTPVLNLGVLNFNYDINNFIGVGVGADVTFELQKLRSCKEKFTVTGSRNTELYPINSTYKGSCPEIVLVTVGEVFDGVPSTEDVNIINTTPVDISPPKFYPSIYGDIRMGSVKTGPSLGIRYLYRFQKTLQFQQVSFTDKSDLQLYLLVKF